MNKQGPKGIGWCDYTWSPVTGCWGPGGSPERPLWCPYCYNIDFCYRFRRSFEPEWHRKRLLEPSRKKRPYNIFVCSAGDLLGDWVPAEWIQSVIEVAANSSRHTFQFLTKNPDRYRDFDWPKNCWLGATATDSRSALDAAFALREVKAAVRFISFEPLLGYIGIEWRQPPPFEWAIIGALTGRANWPTYPQLDQGLPPKAWVTGLIRSVRQPNPDFPIFIKKSLESYFERPPKQYPRPKEHG